MTIRTRCLCYILQRKVINLLLMRELCHSAVLNVIASCHYFLQMMRQSQITSQSLVNVYSSNSLNSIITSQFLNQLHCIWANLREMSRWLLSMSDRVEQKKLLMKKKLNISMRDSADNISFNENCLK